MRSHEDIGRKIQKELWKIKDFSMFGEIFGSLLFIS